MSAAIALEYEIEEEVVDVNDIRGGVNVLVDGQRVARYPDEDSIDWGHPWMPDYQGEFLHTHLMRFIHAAHSLSSGETGIYDPEKVRFKPQVTRLVLEPLSVSDLRIAYRTTSSNLGTPPIPVVESARGYVVDRCAFCRAVSDAAHEYLQEVQSFPLEWGEDLLEELETALQSLDESLETCEETPPSLG